MDVRYQARKTVKHQAGRQIKKKDKESIFCLNKVTKAIKTQGWGKSNNHPVHVKSLRIYKVIEIVHVCQQ